MISFENSLTFAQLMDQNDPLKTFRSKFYIPQHHHQDALYFCGNSLGLQALDVAPAVEKELIKWREKAVEGHFMSEGERWYDYHKNLKKYYQNILGAFPGEITVMNNLTVNLHLMLTTFYQPDSHRNKILLERQAFPSDQYAIESQLRLHGLDPDETMVELQPKEGAWTMTTEEIIQQIDQQGDRLALVLLGGVNYLTGQAFDIQKITDFAHSKNIKVGIDLAHWVGNIPAFLHDWEVDFAIWCTYKYLNSSPGGVGGVFIHEKHATNTTLPRLAGWWGYDEEKRFEMKKGFQAIPDADGWQLSNSHILLLAVHKVNLEIFEMAGMENLRKKSVLLTGYLEYILENIVSHYEFPLRIITPRDPDQRGCQLSILVENGGKKLFDALKQKGVIGDWREPNIIRLSPVPLYNQFEDIYRFGKVLAECIEKEFDLVNN